MNTWWKVALPVFPTREKKSPLAVEESILVGGCQGFILIPADQYAEFVRGTRLAACLATGLGLVYAAVAAFFVND